MFKFTACNLILVTGALGQSTTGPKEFDVVSIKPNSANDNRFMFRTSRGNPTFVGVTLKFLVVHAYDVWAFQVSGGPAWIGTERWDIQAKAPGVEGLQRDQFQTMFRAMLADRFQLKVHSETREMQVYVLLVGKNGSKLTPSTSEARSNRTGRGLFNIKKGRMAEFASRLSVQLGRPVIDKTDLKGEYDFTLEWAPEPGWGGLEALGLPPGPEDPPPADTRGPSIFTAVQEQLGLRLESRKGPVEIIVIDHVEKPSAN